MKIRQLLTDLRRQDIRLWLDEETTLRYSAPEGALTSDLRQAILTHKSEIISFLGTAASSQPPIPSLAPVKRTGQSLPLSFAQQRLWFLSQLEPDNPSYNVPVALKLCGPLDKKALIDSIQQIVVRQECLRTAFGSDEGQPQLYIADQVDLPLTQLDLQYLASKPDEQIQFLQAQITQVAQQPFGLSQPPLLRLFLYQLGPQEHVFFLTVHHIIADAWSIGNFMTELALFYSAYRRGESATLPPLPIQYADFAHWQQQWLQGDVLKRHLDYWRTQLTGAQPLLELPTDRPRGPRQTYCGANYHFTLPATLFSQLNNFSQQSSVTTFMTLLAAFYAFLYRYTRQTDLTVGTPIANRQRPELEKLIGLFANTLALRLKCQGEMTFQMLLRQTRESAMNAYAHQDLPFEKLVAELQPRRHLGHTPLFQTMFALQNVPVSPGQMADLTFDYFPINRGTARFDLMLFLMGDGDTLRGTVEYNTDLFTADTIARMMRHYETLLQDAIRNPEKTINRLSLLTDDEAAFYCAQHNHTARHYPNDACLHDLVALQAERTPTATAVTSDQGHLTYAELEQQSHQLAQALQARGIGSDTVVAVCLERTPTLLVALLAILKAGAAYLPLDPTYPTSRLAFMLQDSGAKLILTQTTLASRLPDSPQVKLCLDGTTNLFQKRSPTPPSVAVDPDDLAYLIYTSGSTGQPKGVQIPHRAAVNFLLSMQERPGCPDNTILLAVTTISFDIALLELFLPLTVGGTVALASQAVAADGRQLLLMLQETKATLFQATPATYRALLSAGWEPGMTPDLTVLCGGEALPVDLAAQLKERAAAVWNMYGPTETTVWSTCQQLPDNDDCIPLGAPIANTQLYVLDKQLQPVPPGVTGELYIGGHGVARGYHNRPQLTASRFIPDPFNSGLNQKIYRTGDLVRQMADGTLLYSGRADFQVKVRGFRIELGEIEQALSQHPLITTAVVTSHPDRSGANQLVAYYLAAGTGLSAAVLRHFLAQSVPVYMIPSRFVCLQEMPLTTNGKIDRQALPAPDYTELNLAERFIPPRTPIEQVLAGLWRPLLDLPTVGVQDNFFEIGGHSLLGVQLISRIAATLDTRLPLVALFEYPTIAAQAEAVQEVMRSEQGISLPPLLPQPRDQTLPLSYAQERMWILYQLAPESPAYNVTHAVKLHGIVNRDRLNQALNALVARHEILRTTFHSGTEQPYLQIAPHLSLSLPLLDLRARSASQKVAVTQQRVKEMAHTPFDLTTGPLLCLELIQLADEEYILSFVIHHAIFDAWSADIFFQELWQLYQSDDDEAALPPLACQYADYAQWQRQWLSGDVLQAQLAYWRQQLQAPRNILELPTDYPRPATPTFNGARRNFQLSPQLSQALKQLSQERGVTLYMTLLAAFQLLLHRYTGNEDILVGSPIAQRPHLVLEQMLGFFVNTLVIRTDFTQVASFLQLLTQVRQTVIAAYSHQDLPFEKLVDELQPERDWNVNPLFQVLFGWQNSPHSVHTVDDLRLETVAIDKETTHFDLSLVMHDTGTALAGVIDYSTDLFAATTIERLQSHLETLLTNITAAPETPLSKLEILPDSERQRLLNWGRPRRDFDIDQCLHTAFLVQAKQTPDATAVIVDDDQLTYQELSQRSTLLAQQLRESGLKPEDRVAICLPRSTAMIVSVMGVLQAGGTYIPLDPTLPTPRLMTMLEDAAATTLLCLSNFNLPAFEGRRIHLDTISWSAPTKPVPNQTTPDQLAYIIYTSGSTGDPKGVMVNHRSVMNLVHGFCQVHGDSQAQGFGPGQRILVVPPLSFDASVGDIFPGLLNGATLLFPSSSVFLEGQALAAYCRKELITAIDTAASLWHQWLESWARLSPGTLLPSLQIMMVGGEQVDRDKLQLWARLTGNRVRFFNHYGPTETTVCTTVFRTIDGSELPPSTAVPIGQPLPNTEVYVLDSQQRLQPTGVPGELYIGGVGVSQGYHNKPEQTESAFVLSPLATQPQRRLYRTGDLVRYRADGCLEFLGRLDNQVKIRGFRVELSGIVHHLQQQPGVQRAVVVMQADRQGQPQLVAYVISDAAAPSLTPESLRQQLRQTLPGYMVPAAFVIVDSIPLTSNGKIDLQALPAPQASAFGLNIPLEPPQSPTEKQLAAIWQQLLGYDQIGRHTNFFEIGGHSLLVTQVMARIRAAFQVEVSMRRFFTGPTLMEVAAAIDEQQPVAKRPLLRRVERSQYQIGSKTPGNNKS